tara:strand:+ start:161 stop:514 length:354 start_codon:yes stop_codon:yes gene_type:complete
MVGVGTAVAVGTGLGDTLVGVGTFVGVGTTVGSTVGSRVSARIGVSVGVGSGVFNEPRTLPSGDGVSGSSTTSLMLMVRVPPVACPVRPSPQPMIATKATRMAKNLTEGLIMEIDER